MKNKCKYCNHRVYRNRDICSTCAEKIVLVKKLTAICQLIKDDAKGADISNE